MTAYRQAMAGFAAMGTLEVWYARIAQGQFPQALRSAADPSRTKKDTKAVKRTGKVARREAAKALTRDSLQTLSKLAEQVDGRYRIVSRPPVVVPAQICGAFTEAVRSGRLPALESV